jgi:hypothetical protein
LKHNIISELRFWQDTVNLKDEFRRIDFNSFFVNLVPPNEKQANKNLTVHSMKTGVI